MRKFSIYLIFMFLTLNSLGQNALENSVDEYFEMIRNNVYSVSPSKEIYSLENAVDLLPLLEKFYIDSTAKIRLKAYYLTYKSTYKSENQELKNKAVINLIQALKDKDSGNNGTLAEYLTYYSCNDFSRIAKDSLISVMYSQPSDRIIKLIGFVGLHDQVPYLKESLKNGNFKTQKLIWATHIALARLGDHEEIKYCTEIVKKQGVNDNVIYELIPDLIYTHQKQSFNYIVQLLQSNETNCYSANPENTRKIVCGYRLMEFLAPVIKGFPLEVDSFGDLIVDDYEKALIKVREWFKVNSESYEIINCFY